VIIIVEFSPPLRFPAVDIRLEHPVNVVLRLSCDCFGEIEQPEPNVFQNHHNKEGVSPNEKERGRGNYYLP